MVPETERFGGKETAGAIEPPQSRKKYILR